MNLPRTFANEGDMRGKTRNEAEIAITENQEKKTDEIGINTPRETSPGVAMPDIVNGINTSRETSLGVAIIVVFQSARKANHLRPAIIQCNCFQGRIKSDVSKRAEEYLMCWMHIRTCHLRLGIIQQFRMPNS